MLAGSKGDVADIGEKIECEVGGWPGVETRAHRFGGVEFRVNGHEIGHLHGERMADLPFPVRMREELVAAGKARVHHVRPSLRVDRRQTAQPLLPQILDLLLRKHAHALVPFRAVNRS